VRDKGQWRRRYNFELYIDVVKYIKINRLKWAGHDMRMDNNRIIKRMLNTRSEGKRETGRPKLRWGIVWTMTSEFQERGIWQYIGKSGGSF
jgi:hypothetical protein